MCLIRGNEKRGECMRITRKWAMPNKETFGIKPIEELLSRYIKAGDVVVDPFARNAKWGTITNDLDPTTEAKNHMDALEFLQFMSARTADIVLYDPPYSTRQVSESYKKMGRVVNTQTTQSSYWAKQKDEILRVLKPGGLVISFGWNSTGLGESRGCIRKEILLVAHGGMHNDTIVVVEKKGE